MILRFIEKHNYFNLQQSSEFSLENNTGTWPLSNSFNIMKLPRIELKSNPLIRLPDLWKHFFNNSEYAIECAKLRALRALVPYVPYVSSCLKCPRALHVLVPYVPSCPVKSEQSILY